MNGEPLPEEHGFPVRMVVPGLYGYVSATKWVVELEVTRFDRASAYWTDRGWGEKGPIKIESRIDVVAAGWRRAVTVAGRRLAPAHRHREGRGAGRRRTVGRGRAGRRDLDRHLGAVALPRRRADRASTRCACGRPAPTARCRPRTSRTCCPTARPATTRSSVVALVVFAPVTSRVPPRPIIMTPPAAPRRSTRFGERANQSRAVPAMSAQVLSMTSASRKKISPSSASCSGMAPAPVVDELREHRDEERDRLRVGDADDEALEQQPEGRPRRRRGIRHRPRLAVADRLDAEEDQVRRSDDLDDREHHDGLRDERPDAERDRGDGGQHPERVAEHAEQAAAAAERDGAAEHEQHARAGKDDEQHRRESEGEQVGPRDHGRQGIARAHCAEREPARLQRRSHGTPDHDRPAGRPRHHHVRAGALAPPRRLRAGREAPEGRDHRAGLPADPAAGDLPRARRAVPACRRSSRSA